MRELKKFKLVAIHEEIVVVSENKRLFEIMIFHDEGWNVPVHYSELPDHPVTTKVTKKIVGFELSLNRADVYLTLSMTKGVYDLVRIDIETRSSKNWITVASEVPIIKKEFVELKVGDRFFYPESIGFLTFAAPTGNGKTYFVVNNIKGLLDKFDAVVIFNFEITSEDYKERIERRYSTSSLIKNGIDYKKLFFVNDSSKTIDDVLKHFNYEYDRICFIVDNIDNIPLESNNGLTQDEWLTHFDNIIKRFGYFGIVLSQFRKDLESILDKSGERIAVNSPYDLSGSKKRSDLAKSVLMTARLQNGTYDYKLLKPGTAFYVDNQGSPVYLLAAGVKK